MLILGDVLAIVAALTGVCLSTWALIVGLSLLFNGRVEVARERIARAPWRTGFVGALVGAGFVIAGLVLANLPDPISKGVGVLLILSVIVVALIGVSGLVALLADHLRRLDPAQSGYGAVCRGSAFLVLGSVLPFVGWFLLAPMVLFVGFGAGWHSLLRRANRRAEVEALG